MKEKKKLPLRRERVEQEMKILKITELVIWGVCLTVHIFIILMLIYFVKQ